jgi:ribose transport system substrate-binding protein
MKKQNILRLIILMSLVALTSGLLVACKRGEQKKNQPVIAVIPKGVSHSFWLTMKSGADAAGQELGATIDWKGPASETDIAGQINIVEDAINRQVDGIVIAPSHGDSLVPIVERAQREGIPVSIFDSGISTEKYLSYVATDNRAGGALAADRMGERLNGKGQVAILGVKKGSVSTDEREQGFADRLKEKFPEIQVVQWLYGDANASKSLSTAEDILTTHPDLNGLFASNESSTVGAVRAIRQRDLGARVVLIGFDATPDLVSNVRDSSIDSLVIQNPFKMGYEGVRTILDKLAGREPARHIDTGVSLLTRENVDTPEIQQLIKTP